MADVIKFNNLVIKDLDFTNFESFCAIMNFLKLKKMIIDSDDRLHTDILDMESLTSSATSKESEEA